MDNIVFLCLIYWNNKGAVFTNSGASASVKMDNEEYYWYSSNPYRLNHRVKDKSINAFKEISKLSQHKVHWKNKCQQDLDRILEIEDEEFYQIKVDTQVLDKHTAEVNSFLNDYKILKISSPMATRKSNIIDETIKQSHIQEKRVLIVTNRISLANDIEKKYKHHNIKHYQAHNYNIGDSLVVQFDSLHRFNAEDFDVVILDEVTSLLLYMTSTYTGKEDVHFKNMNFFARLHDKQFLISDSFMIHFPIEGRTLGIYNYFREDLEVIEFSDKRYLESKIIRESKKGLVSVSSNEKRFLVQVAKKLEKRGKRCLLLTGDTENKERIYELFQKETIPYDCILFSPTLTVGVSINCTINHHFHYDNSGTISVIDSLQMTRRARDARVLNYCIRGITSFKDTDLESIGRKLYRYKIQNQYGVTFGLTNAGKIFSDIIRVSNIFKNTHKYAFRELLLYQFKKVKTCNWKA